MHVWCCACGIGPGPTSAFVVGVKMGLSSFWKRISLGIWIYPRVDIGKPVAFEYRPCFLILPNLYFSPLDACTHAHATHSLVPISSVHIL